MNINTKKVSVSVAVNIIAELMSCNKMCMFILYFSNIQPKSI